MLCLSSLATHGCSRSRVIVRVSPCRPLHPGTHRPGQVAAHPLPLHQLQADVDVKFPAVLDVLVAAQHVFAAGIETAR